MKNKYFLTTAALLSAVSFTACNDMLDTDPRVTELNQATFPGKPADVESLNTATYAIMNVLGGGDADTYNIFWWWEVMSDNCYGSGGLQDNKAKSLHHLVEMSNDQYGGPFSSLYGGVSRANNTIATIDNVPWTDRQKEQRNQLLGEAYFMRGLYTLWLTQLYGDIPLITSNQITDEMRVQVSAETVIYPQILSDFVSAKNLMSATKSSGHANKFVAEAFAARAYMFWAGFYKKVSDLSGSAPSIDLVAQEGCEAASLSKEDVLNGLKDVISNGGYKLLKDYRSLWQYSNSFVWADAQDGYAGDGKDGVGHAYNFIADMAYEDCFDQPGNGNGNNEELFQIQFMNASSWSIPSGNYSTSRMFCNYLGCWWGLRVNGDNGDKDHTYPFNEGWGQGTPSCNIWDDWTNAEKNGGTDSYTDKRKLASLIDCVNEFKQNGQKGYSFVKDDCEESGYAVKKWCGVCCDANTAKNDTWWSQCEGYESSSLGNSMQGDHFADFYLMRYADVLLMASELTGDAQYMNQVQKRAGVPETAYSLKALQNERRWEFAFEGLRFNDMRRWSGIDGGQDCYAANALEAQAGKTVVCLGDVDNKLEMKHMTCSWKERYAATNGFLSKPQSQITLMNGQMEQNKGWDSADPTTQYKTLY